MIPAIAVSLGVWSVGAALAQEGERFGDWAAIRILDEATERYVWHAMVKNEAQGTALIVNRNPVNSALILTFYAEDRVSGFAVDIKIDNNPRIDSTAWPSSNIEDGYSLLMIVASDMERSLIENLGDGESVRIRYQNASGQFRVTEFSLDGAWKALAAVKYVVR